MKEKINSGTYRFEEVPCGGCGAASGEVLSEKDRYGLEFSVMICRECGLIYTNPRMDQASYAAFYDAEYRPLYHGEASPMEELHQKTLRRGRKVASFFEEHSIHLKGLRVVEVGCGSGGILAHLRDEWGCIVTGCDFGSEGIRYGKEEFGLDLCEGSLDSLKDAPQADLIVYSHVFEHVLDLRAELASVRRALKPGGMIYVEVPSVKGIRSNYQWDFLRLLQNAHTFHFTKESLESVMAKAGFHMVGGNQFTQAIFVDAGRSQSSSLRSTNDHEDVMAFLRSTERWRVPGHTYVHLKRAAGRAAYKSGFAKLINGWKS